MTSRRGERGLALVVVLWVVAALSLIATAMIASALNAAHIDRNAWVQLQVQTRADAGIQAAILALFDPDPADRLFLDGRTQTLPIPGATVEVGVQDESGHIDLNFAGRNLLRDYFKATGADDADALADNVVAWRTPKGSLADDRETDAANRPRGGPFQSVEELRLVAGMTPELFARVAPGLTVYSHHANFDTRIAPDLVLAVIPGMAQQASGAARRWPSPALPGHAFAITATAAEGQTRFSRRAVVLLTGDPSRPYWVLDWR